VLVVLDPRLLQSPSTTSGVGEQTWVLVNSARSVCVHGVPPEHVVTGDASGIAQRSLGRDLPNIPMLAVLVTLLTPLGGEPFLIWLDRRLSEEFRPEIVATNLQAARQAMEAVKDASATVAPRV
jgi:Pyruvate/2-oxoacid:ferredoxin oxidoreductase gamma subunit